MACQFRYEGVEPGEEDSTHFRATMISFICSRKTVNQKLANFRFTSKLDGAVNRRT